MLVDDADACRLAAKWFLGSFGYDVAAIASAEEALTRFDPQVHAAVVTDNSMPGMSGAEMAQQMKLRSPSTPIVMFSGAPPEDAAYLDAVIRKPAHLMVVKDALDSVLGIRTQR